MEEEIDSLHYREQKCIAFQGIISAIRCVSYSSTSQDASGVRPTQVKERSSVCTSVSESYHINKGGRKYQQAKESTSKQKSPSLEQRNIITRSCTKRQIATVEATDHHPVPSQHSCLTRSAGKKRMLHNFLQDNSPAKKESKEVMETAQTYETGNKEIADVSEKVHSQRTCHNSWESVLWTAVKDNLTQQLNFSNVFPESFPCKFNYIHKEFLMKQYNLQAAKFEPKECLMSGEMNHFENACPLKYYEVAILGINHDMAIEVALLHDSYLFQVKDTSRNAVFSHISGTSSCQETINQGGLSELLSLSGTGNTVAIMISYSKGREILQKIQKGYQVTMAIEVGKKHGSWMNNYSIFFVSVSFFIVTAATVGYFIFYSARRLRLARAQNRRQRRLKADARKAIGRLQLRTLKQGDQETGPDADNCAVCIEVYKPNDVVRILTCNHLFHKSCIDPWLLEHRTCPMCKCDILKALGIEVDVEDRVESFQAAAVSSEASNIPSINEEDNHSETASSGYASVQGTDEPAPEERVTSESDHLHLVVNTPQIPHVDALPHLDNPGFEGDEVQVHEAKS